MRTTIDLPDELLPDINVWFAFSVANHVHHQRARAYWYEESADQLALCALTGAAGPNCRRAQ